MAVLIAFCDNKQREIVEAKSSMFNIDDHPRTRFAKTSLPVGIRAEVRVRVKP